MSGLSFQLFDEALVDCSCCCPLLRPDPERQHGAAGAACTESVLGSFFWNCKTCFLGVIDRLDEDVSKVAVAFGDRSVSFFVANPQGSESQQVWSVVRGFELFLQYRQERGVRHFIPADAIKARPAQMLPTKRDPINALNEWYGLVLSALHCCQLVLTAAKAL